MEQKLKQRICIEFYVKLQISATETFEMLNKAFPNDAPKRTTVFECHSSRIVTEDLKLKKTPAKFIPRFLTNEQKLCRLATYIAPNDFFLLPKLKAVLKERYFDTRDDIIEKLLLALKSIPKEAYKNCFNNWEKRWRWKTYRRRPLESCLTHPSRMLYPPGEVYTPPSTPEPSLRRTRVKPSAFDETMAQKISREPIDIRSESQYQQGPDTFLLPLRDPEFPVRVRQYLRIGSGRSPMLADHLRDKHWSDSKVTVRERRKFLDVLDEEIDDEKKGKTKEIIPFRLQREIGSLAETESTARRKRSQDDITGTVPYFREKLRDVVIREGQDVVLHCMAVGQPSPLYSWFRNDGILVESSRVEMTRLPSGQAQLRLKPGKAYDVGMYKCVARNQHGVALCRARLKIGDNPGKPEPPKVAQCSATAVEVTWFPPKNEGNSIILSYLLEYREASQESWTKALDSIPHEFYIVRNLQPSTTYYFRITARNKFGWGEPSAASEICCTLEEGSPGMKVSKARKFQLDMIDRGQAVGPEIDEEEVPRLDYDVELNPIGLEEGDPMELYNFISEVSRGRHSLVATVWSKKLNTTLVAKVIQRKSSDGELEEYETLRSLRHERIATLLTASAHPGALILAMERLSGLDVLTFLSSHVQYSEQSVSHILAQVLNGLEYLHFRGIGYLELQPDNVVMMDSHHLDIKLVDLGSARYLPPEGARLHWRPADIEYLAPEIVKEEEVTCAADIWGVAVLAYILLSGVSPFRGDDIRETTSNILYVRFRFDSLYRNVTQEATRFLMQLFKRTPQKRPTIEECLENKWLLPSEFLIRKREHAVFLTHKLHQFSEQFHAAKQLNTPPALLNMFGMTLTKSVTLETDNYEEL
ncbi:SPEG [Cordylochernes scorpioides]|uniref:SPEG n=1 Tax=Cordylochernes scorpioides TaxID=51811 RepID=A0ABY6L1E2_9ARAC|nr:SPEG [Cordylochernes scorpioides]